MVTDLISPRSKAVRWLVFLIGLHSCILGCLMLFAPEFMLAVFGFESQRQLFFTSQSGIFLLILGVCYLLALRFSQLILVILVSKGFAVVFLSTHAGLLGAPPSIWAAAAGDATMLVLLSLALVHQARSSLRSDKLRL